NREELAFPVESAGKAAQAVIGGEDSVARHEDGDRIRAARATDGANRVGVADGLGHFRIAPGLAGRNFTQGLPDALLKVGAAGEIEWRKLAHCLAGQRLVESVDRRCVPALDLR